MIYLKTDGRTMKNGSFLGGRRNIRDISYHSLMLLNLLARTPLELKWRRLDNRSHPAKDEHSMQPLDLQQEK